MKNRKRITLLVNRSETIALKILNREVASCAWLTMIVLLASQSAQAAPLYSTIIENNNTAAVLDSGTNFASGSDTVAGGGNMSGTASAMNTRIELHAQVFRGTGTIPNTQAAASMTFFDIVFSDESDPASTASINVGVNFGGEYFTTGTGVTSFKVKIRLAPTPDTTPIIFDSFFSTGTFSETTTPISVVLGTPYRLSFLGDLDRRGGGSNTASTADAAVELGLIPFSLPAGFTANSADASIVNNANIVPEPTALALLGFGIAGLVLQGRRFGNR